MEKTYTESQIQGVKKAPDPRLGSATLYIIKTFKPFKYFKVMLYNISKTNWTILKTNLLNLHRFSFQNIRSRSGSGVGKIIPDPTCPKSAVSNRIWIWIDVSVPTVSGSGSISHRSGSFHHYAKIVRKTLIPTVLWLLYEFLTLKNDVTVPSKRNKQKKIFFKNFLLTSSRSLTKIAGSTSTSGSISQRYGSANEDPDPFQNFMDPQTGQKHCQTSLRNLLG